MGAEFHQEAGILIGKEEEQAEEGQRQIVDAQSQTVINPTQPPTPKSNLVENPRASLPISDNTTPPVPLKKEERLDAEMEPVRDQRPQEPRQHQPRQQDERRRDRHRARDYDRPKHRPQDQKKENPIWNTVANLRNEKIHQSAQEVTKKILMPSLPPVADPEPKIFAPLAVAEFQALPTTQTLNEPLLPPVPKPPVRTVLKPGQSHKV
jgi:hypothetical protein